MDISIDAISGQQLLDRAAGPTSDMRALGEQFDRLMAQDADPHRYDAPASSSRESIGMELVTKSDQMMRQTHEEMDRFLQDAPHLDMTELAARQMDLTMRVAMAHFQFSACTSVAQSSKNGLQTLMRNQ